LIIGLAEGVLLAKVFSLRVGGATALMIAANYFSAWIGGLFIRGAVVHAIHADLNNGWRWFWVLVVATYLMTLVLEWPFVAFSFLGTKNWLKRSWMGNLLVQTLSYAVLFWWYWMASGTSLYTHMHVVLPSEISLPQHVLVYFISDKDGDVYGRPLNSSSKDQLVFRLNSKGQSDRLLVRPSSARTNCWDLIARLDTDNYRNPKLITMKEAMTNEAVLDSRASLDPPQYEGTWFNFGEVPRLGAGPTNGWEFRTGFWPVEGLRGENKTTGAKIRFSFETPFGQWIVRNATLLPADKVIFQLGEDQICVFDPDTKKIALLVRGKGPVAVIGSELPALAPGVPADPPPKRPQN
jgi:hypothetical protein